MTTTIVKPESNAHWYDGKTGEPRHDSDLRDARKFGYFPSVTTVLSQVLAKPQLEAWKQSQAVLSALTLPRLADETEDAYAKRVVEDSKQHSIKAAEFGTRIHGNCEAVHNYSPLPHADAEPWMYPYYTDWFNVNIQEVKSVEKILVNQTHGYAGKTDLIAVMKGVGPCLIDLKTQGVKNGKPAFYDEWVYQLAAYRFAQDDSLDVVSVVIDSNAPGIIEAKVWTQDEMMRGWEIFKCALKLWKLTKRFDPTGATRFE